MAYGVIRVENASGITLGKDLFSLKCESAIENGHVVVVGDYISGEVRAFSTPAANTAMGKVAIIASEEIVKTKSYNTLAEFINEAGSIAEASLKLNKIFETAQAVADQYIDNIKRLEKLNI